MSSSSTNPAQDYNTKKLEWVHPVISELNISDTDGKANITPEAYTANGANDNRFGPS